MPRDHHVTFYDDDVELVDELTDFVAEGISLGEAVVLVVTAEHLAALTASLDSVGCSLAAAQARGQCFLADAAKTLSALLRHDRPDFDLFLATVGGLLADVAASGRPVRVFGEMVALLWERGDVAAAMELEALWNRLGRVLRFSLLCGYPSGSLTEPGDLRDARAVCQLHSDVFPPTGYEADELFAAGPSALVHTPV